MMASHCYYHVIDYYADIADYAVISMPSRLDIDYATMPLPLMLLHAYCRHYADILLLELA